MEARYDLRHYQKDAANNVWNGFQKGIKRQLVVLPTGAGKAILAAKMSAFDPLQKALICCHRNELCEQAADKLLKATGIIAGMEKAESYASFDDNVVVASIPSLANPKRLARWARDHFKFVVVDECHHAMSDTWMRVIEHFDESFLMGITATPHRGDKRSLGRLFENLAYETTLFDLIRQGYLVPIKIKTCNLKIPVEDKGRELSDREAAAAIEPILELVADAVLQHAAKKKTLVFLPLRETSKKFMQMLRDRGLAAEHVDGDDPDRVRKLQDFKEGRITHLCNAMLLTEGYDEPSIECVIPLRPTTSQPLFSQMVGRGTRLSPETGKEYLLLLDFLWLHDRHKLVRPSRLVAATDKLAAAMDAMMDAEAIKGGGSKELDLEALHEAAVSDRESKLRAELEKKAARAERTIDAMAYALDCSDSALAEFDHYDGEIITPASPRQLELLKRFGITPSTIKSAAHAKEVIGKFMTRSRMKLATPKQMAMLRRFKHPSPHTATEAEASKFLDIRFGKKGGRA